MSTNKEFRMKTEFRGIALGDERLNKRCVELAKALGKHPDESIPQSCGDWGATKAAYRFFENDRVTREALLAPHIAQTVEQSRLTEVIAIGDTTYLNFTAHPSVEDLGPIGTTEGLQGMVVHNTIAVTADQGEVLGMLHQEVWVRDGRYPKEETWFQRHKREKESERWQRGVKAVEELGLKGAIHVFDREGDIYGVLRLLEKRRFVIRAAQNRALSSDEGHLFEVLRQSDPIGKMTVYVPPRGGRKAREALLTLRRKHMVLRPPATEPKEQAAPVEVNLVEACEHHAPKGCTPLHWVLLTSEAVDTLEQCVHVIKLYKYRWKVEEFHKSLKTGCQIEQRQLQTRHRLEAVLGLYSVIGMMLLRIRDAAREAGRQATEYFNEVQLKLLHRRYPKIGKKPKVRDAFRAVAQLGGFLARKSDGEPGWKTLWLGMRELLAMERGYYYSHA